MIEQNKETVQRFREVADARLEESYSRFSSEVYARIAGKSDSEEGKIRCVLEDIAITLRKIAAVQCGAPVQNFPY